MMRWLFKRRVLLLLVVVCCVSYFRNKLEFLFLKSDAREFPIDIPEQIDPQKGSSQSGSLQDTRLPKITDRIIENQDKLFTDSIEATTNDPSDVLEDLPTLPDLPDSPVDETLNTNLDKAGLAEKQTQSNFNGRTGSTSKEYITIKNKNILDAGFTVQVTRPGTKTLQDEKVNNLAKSPSIKTTAVLDQINHDEHPESPPFKGQKETVTNSRRKFDNLPAKTLTLETEKITSPLKHKKGKVELEGKRSDELSSKTETNKFVETFLPLESQAGKGANEGGKRDMYLRSKIFKGESTGTSSPHDDQYKRNSRKGRGDDDLPAKTTTHEYVETPPIHDEIIGNKGKVINDPTEKAITDKLVETPPPVEDQQETRPLPTTTTKRPTTTMPTKRPTTGKRSTTTTSTNRPTTTTSTKRPTKRPTTTTSTKRPMTTTSTKRPTTKKQPTTSTSTKRPTTISSELTVRIRHLERCSGSFKRWYKRRDIYKDKNVEEVNKFITLSCSKRRRINRCEKEKIVGRLFVDRQVVTLRWLYDNELSFVRPGGWFYPPDCQARSHTAILIPFRNREQHLPVLLRHLHPILKRQQIHYRIFVIDQVDGFSFNRAKLFNVGYKEALRHFPYDCFVFHDVDLIPEDDRIEYTCKRSPSHMSVGVDTMGYRLPYQDIFGGVSSMSRQHFESLNGFSNIFWTWGGEDDNLSKRLRDQGLTIHRQSVQISRYTMLGHKEAQKSEINDRVRFLEESFEHFDHDGINSLQYRVVKRDYQLLYTRIKVNLRKDRDDFFGIDEVSLDV